MKNKKTFVITITVVLCFVLIGGIGIYLLKQYDKFQDDSNISFNKVEYLNIDNIIYYDSTVNIDNEIESLKIIANQLKNNEVYNKHKYFFERKQAEFDGEKIYRMSQIQDEIVLDNTKFNIYFNVDTKSFYTVSVSSTRI